MRTWAPAKGSSSGLIFFSDKETSGCVRALALSNCYGSCFNVFFFTGKLNPARGKLS